MRWVTSVDHKDIGILYLLFGLAAGCRWDHGGDDSHRACHARMTLISNTFYNSLLTSHGITMLFLFGTPILAAFSNYFIPLLIDADDMAFPRINAIAFWLLPPAALLIWAGFFRAGYRTCHPRTDCVDDVHAALRRAGERRCGPDAPRPAPLGCLGHDGRD